MDPSHLREGIESAQFWLFQDDTHLLSRALLVDLRNRFQDTTRPQRLKGGAKQVLQTFQTSGVSRTNESENRKVGKLENKKARREMRELTLKTAIGFLGN